MPDELRKPPRDAEGKRIPETAEQKRERLAKAREWRQLHRWSPNQLRHTGATAIKKDHGIEGVRVVLGHSRHDTAAIYAEENFAKAAEIMKQIG